MQYNNKTHIIETGFNLFWTNFEPYFSQCINKKHTFSEYKTTVTLIISLIYLSESAVPQSSESGIVAKVSFISMMFRSAFSISIR